jgi:DNA-binding LacI/PurR family transcriptional regulator
MTAVRLIDIARRAGVSSSTVSAVLSGRDIGIRFSPERAALIRRVAREMNYVPNISARILNHQASFTLGVMIDSDDIPVRFRQLAAIEQAATRRGYRLLVTETHNDPVSQHKNYLTLRQYGVDGIICHTNTYSEKTMRPDKTIFYGAAPVAGFSTAYYDVRTAYKDAAALFARAQRRVALVISDSTSFDSVRARREAFLEFFPGAEKQLCLLPAGIGTDSDIREVMADLLQQRLLPAGVTAVILQNDAWCLALASEAARLGIKVPADLALIGQDNSFFCTCYRPSLSSIDSSLAALGEAVLELVLERIAEPEAPCRNIAVATDLVLRESTPVVS